MCIHKKINKIVLSDDDNKVLQHLITLQHIHTEQMPLKYVKVKCWKKYANFQFYDDVVLQQEQ